jgi:hypothetical protein
MSKYYKSIMAIIGTVASILYAYNVTHPNTYVSMFIGVATVLGVFTVPNKERL